ncbi:MAG TPA: ABC transporter substrate-binding protein [Thermomonospora sp.]|nr:ABC transporter substrate-binding protein [Thermomonospora sp.]
MSRRAAAGLLAATAVILSACASPAGERTSGGASSGVSVTSCGQRLTFAKTPARAVTLDQSATETLLALGLAGRMAGTAFRKAEISPPYRADYGKVPVLSAKMLTAEGLRAANPDVAVASFTAMFTKDRVGTREELRGIGLPTYVSAVDCPKDGPAGATPFDLLFRDYRNYGHIFGVSDRANRLVAEQRKVLDEAARLRRNLKGSPSVAYVYSVFNGTPYVAGKGGIPSEISRLTGVRNVFDDVGEQWPQVTWEAVAQRRPDVIVLGDLTTAASPAGNTAAQKLATMRAHPTLSRLPAVRDNRTITVTAIEMDPGVRSVNVLRALVDGVRRFGHAD